MTETTPVAQDTGRQPTASAISALLRKAGFARFQMNRRGLTTFSGYRVTQNDDGSVRVLHSAALSGTDVKPHLARYAEAITAAGWSVETGEYELAVTATSTGKD